MGTVYMDILAGKLTVPLTVLHIGGGAVVDFFTPPPFYSLILAIPYIHLEE